MDDSTQVKTADQVLRVHAIATQQTVALYNRSNKYSGHFQLGVDYIEGNWEICHPPKLIGHTSANAIFGIE
ncbi:hypothetical protein SH501x_001923 [Pirellulaceae bacterium SH501]